MNIAKSIWRTNDMLPFSKDREGNRLVLWFDTEQISMLNEFIASQYHLSVIRNITVVNFCKNISRLQAAALPIYYRHVTNRGNEDAVDGVRDMLCQAERTVFEGMPSIRSRSGEFICFLLLIEPTQESFDQDCWNQIANVINLLRFRSNFLPKGDSRYFSS